MADKEFIEHWMGGKIYKLANGQFQWSFRGTKISAKNKGGLKSRIDGHLRSTYYQGRR